MEQQAMILVSGQLGRIDAEDAHLLEGTSLTLRDGYINVVFRNGDTRKTEALHRVVLKNAGHDLTDKVVHHRDGNPLNNQKSNLFITSAAENSKGHAGKRRPGHQFKGYDIKHSLTYGKSYEARIGVNYSTKGLGTYLTEVDAAIAYDLAALKYIGKELAILNFPDNDYTNMTLEQWRTEKAIKHRAGKWSSSKKATNEAIKRLPLDMKSNVSVSQMAMLCGLSRSRLYQLIEEGFLPKPRYSARQRPYYDKELKRQCLQVIETGEGINGEPLLLRKR